MLSGVYVCARPHVCVYVRAQMAAMQGIPKILKDSGRRAIRELGSFIRVPPPHHVPHPQACQVRGCLRTFTPAVPSAWSLFLNMHRPHSLTFFTSLLRCDFSETLITVFTFADHPPHSMQSVYVLSLFHLFSMTFTFWPAGIVTHLFIILLPCQNASRDLCYSVMAVNRPGSWLVCNKYRVNEGVHAPPILISCLTFTTEISTFTSP